MKGRGINSGQLAQIGMMAYRFQLVAAGATGHLATSLRYVAALAVLLVTTAAEAASDRLVEPAHPLALPERFAGAMTRARLNWFIRGPKPLSIAIDRAQGDSTTIPFFWEAEDGSTIRRMPDSSFRMENWSAAANWTTYVFCEPAGWPAYVCRDGTVHEMSAPDLSTVIFAGKTFKRTLPAADPDDLTSAQPDLPEQ